MKKLFQPSFIVLVPLALVVLNLGNMFYFFKQEFLFKKQWIITHHVLEYSICAIFISVALWVLLYFSITVRIRMLIHAARRFAVGDREVRVKTGVLDEIGQMGQTFNWMAAKINAYISEVHKSEAEVCEAEEKLRYLTNIVPAIIFRYQLMPDGAQKMLFISEGVERLFGLSAKGVLADYYMLWSMILPEDREQLFLSIQESYKVYAPWSADYRIKKEDGVIRWIHGESVPESLLADGSLIWNGTLLDITERKLMELSLKEAEGKIRLLLESTGEAIFGVDRQGLCTFCNSAALRILGYKYADDLIGKNIHQLIHHSALDGAPLGEYECRLCEAYWRGIGSHADHEVFWKSDGTCFPVEYWSYPQLKEGEVIGSVVTFVDITVRKRAEAALQESEERYRSLFESSWDAIMTLEPPSWRFTSGNRAMIRMFRSKDETEFTLHHPWTVSPDRQPDGRISEEKAKEMIETAMREGSHCFEWMHKRIDGDIFPAEVLLTRVEGKGKVFLQSTVRDITERKQAEEDIHKLNTELEQRVSDRTAELVVANRILKKTALELERASRVKSEFLASMSHELRTPLNSVIGFSEVLYDETFGPLNVKQKDYLKDILDCGRHLLFLINDILDLSKIEAGRMELSLSVFPLNDLLKESLMLIVEKAALKNISLESDLSAGIGDFQGDERKVKEVLYNLLSNAVKFTPQGGKVGVRAQKKDAVVEVAVWDTGIGIAPEFHEKVFEEFFQIANVYTRTNEGTGLGLALSKKIIELHGGRMWVESAGAGKGAVFKFTLPVVV